MRSPHRLLHITRTEAAYLVCGAIVIVDIIAFIAKVANKQVTTESVFNPLTWILGPVTTYGWAVVLILTVLAALVYLLGVRLQRRTPRR